MTANARGRLRLALPMALAVAASLSGCLGGSDHVLPQPDQVQDVQVGETYRFVMGTHCGVKFINLDGDSWKAVEPLDGSPPSGWDPGKQRGLLKIVSASRATFGDSDGHNVTFERQEGSQLSMCM